MADSMINAPVGSSLNVSGIRMAVPAAGPSPGSTPISVPNVQPMSAKARFCRLIAAARPVMRCCRVSTPATSYPEHAYRQRHLEPMVEDMEHAEAAGERAKGDRNWRAHAE